ncbi:MAG: 16S rRNA (guanine(527)-N(7))-methyltransferase RsmG [Alphaproteobacteria bacterium]|nr:16S rRNA (guanine(527)-N(7))-methyltransferase RsmG [Alphaproteobacteria bacterium]
MKTWSTKLNLVGPGTLEQIWHRHFLDSAQFLSHGPPKNPDAPQVWADIGSGAGFPGMVLAIMGASPMHLVEANSNKCEFLSEVARATATEVTVHDRRVETMAPSDFSPTGVNVIAVRAVAPLPKLLKSIDGIITPNTVLLLAAGQDVESKLTKASKSWKMTVERLPSITHPASIILRIQDLQANGTNTDNTQPIP